MQCKTPTSVVTGGKRGLAVEVGLVTDGAQSSNPLSVYDFIVIPSRLRLVRKCARTRMRSARGRRDRVMASYSTPCAVGESGIGGGEIGWVDIVKGSLYSVY